MGDKKKKRLVSYPDGEGYKSLKTGRIKTRATVGTPDSIHKAEHVRNVAVGYVLGSGGTGNRRDVFDIDYDYTSPKKKKTTEKKKTGGVTGSRSFVRRNY